MTWFSAKLPLNILICDSDDNHFNICLKFKQIHKVSYWNWYTIHMSRGKGPKAAKQDFTRRAFEWEVKNGEPEYERWAAIKQSAPAFITVIEA